jgi:hypothetical protein
MTMLGLFVISVLLLLDIKRRYKTDLADWNARVQRQEYLRPLASVAGRKHAHAALATNPRPVRKRRR